MRRLIYVLPLLLFIGLVGYFAVGLTKDPRALPSMLVGKSVPAFDLPSLRAGQPGMKTADLAALAPGKPLLVNFWASWCGPCRIEHPVLMRLAREGVTIVGINYKDRESDGRSFLAQLGDPYKVILTDRDGRTGIDFGVYGVPETYIVDAKGEIRYRLDVPIGAKELETIVLPLLKELGR